MKALRGHIFVILGLLIFFSGCSSRKNNSSVTIGIPSDIESINPMFAFGTNDGNISELLYLPLVRHIWNNEIGDLQPELLLAKSVKWNNDSTALDILLRNDINWSDGKKFTAEDVVFTFDVYSDSDTKSRFFGSFNKYYLLPNEKIDIEKSFKVIAPDHLIIRFVPNSVPDLNDINYPILPKHIFGGIPRNELQVKEKECSVAATGPFLPDKWIKDQFISLKRNKTSVLYDPEKVEKIVFKVIPNIQNRILQLKTGEIDYAEHLVPENINTLKTEASLSVLSIKGRSYDYIGWNNIDPDKYSANKERTAHKLFGNAKVRQALTYAINRGEILAEYIGNYGQLAAGPVAPIFKKAINQSLSPYPYNPDTAKIILTREGWIDTDSDGILEKNGKEFAFDLVYLPDKPHRKNAVTIIKNNLAMIGIKVNPVPMEKSVFFEKVLAKKLDAWLAGWAVPIPVELTQFWHSDEKAGGLNLVTFSNPDADAVMDQLGKTGFNEHRNELLKEFQNIIYNEQPCTFLYWTDNLAVYNNRIKNIKSSPLGVIQGCWEWVIE